jgi:HK97 family phage portal protein
MERLFRRPEKRAASDQIPPRSQTSVTPETAISLSAVLRSVQILATPISKMTIETFRYASGMEQKIDNPIFVNKPSLAITRRELLFQTVFDLALSGNAYWLKRFDSAGRVVDVQQLPAKSVGIDTDAFGNLKAYKYVQQTFMPAEVEHMRLIPRAGQIKGISPIETCKNDILTALDLRDYQANWLTSSGIPSGVINANRELSKDDADAITANWHAKQSTRQVAVLQNGFSYQQIALAPKDLMMVEVYSQTIQSIARLFGVPPRLLLTGIDGTSDTYTNLQDENQVFYRHTLAGYTDVISDALSNCLPRGTRVEFNFESLFRADQAARFNMWKVALDAGFMTTDEVRMKEGLNG